MVPGDLECFSRCVDTDLFCAPPQEVQLRVPTSYTLKVHHKFTVVVESQPGLSYSELQAAVARKLQLQPQHIRLR